MKFTYLPLPVRQPPPTLRGATVRCRPIVPVHIVAPLILPPVDACIDSAADDTVFPPHLAMRLGVKLVGTVVVHVSYARVRLLLSDGLETCEWQAMVAFTAVPMRWDLLGHAGFLEFFDVQLRGALREAVLVPNVAFPGQHLVHGPPSP